MGVNDIEHLPYNGESSQDMAAHRQYLNDLKRGKSLFQLKAVASQMTPDIRQSWNAGSFTAVLTPAGHFDAIVCNISYHFNKHGSKYGNIYLFTQQAKRYFQENRHHAVDDGFGVLKFPDGSLYDKNGKIFTFIG